MAVSPPALTAGWSAPDFTLPATDGQSYSLQQLRGEKATLVMFLCNHCPYVQAVLDRIIRDVTDLLPEGVKAIAISSNDPLHYPEDSFPEMIRLAQEQNFPFPYLFDESQTIARAYDAVCTPDFFGFDAGLHLRYRGRLDASRREPAPSEARRELFEALQMIAQTGHGPAEQFPSLGCSIKWKNAE